MFEEFIDQNMLNLAISLLHLATILNRFFFLIWSHQFDQTFEFLLKIANLC